MTNQRSNRRAMIVVVSVACMIPLLLYCNYLAITNAETNVLAWADDEAKVTQDFNAFSTQFDVPDFVLVSWPTERWDDPRYTEIAQLLRTSDGSVYFQVIRDSASAVAELDQSSERISRQSAVRRLVGSLISEDQKQGCVVASLSPTGRENHAHVLTVVRETASKCNVDPNELRFGGVGAELAWLETEGIYAPLRLTPVAVFVCFAVCCLTLRSFKLGAIISFVSGMSALSVAMLMVCIGAPMDAVNSTLPVLGLLLTASLGLHWNGYYQSARSASIADAIGHATKQSILPAVLSILTTCMGLLSLGFSETPAIRTFGKFGAAAAITAGIWALLILPKFVLVANLQPQTSSRQSKRGWIRLSKIVAAKPVLLLGICILFLIATTIGIGKLTTTVRLDGLFREDHRVVADARWIEEELVPLSQMELVVTVPTAKDSKPVSKQARLLRGVNLCRDIEQAVSAEDKDMVAFSAYHVVPTPPSTTGIRGAAARRVYAKRLAEHADRLEELGLLRCRDDGDSWRVSFLTSTLKNKERRSQSKIASQISDRYQALARSSETEADVVVTGVPLLMEEIEQQFFQDLLITYVAAVVLVFLAVWVGFRSLAIASLAMIPNVFPPLVVLGLVGWCGVALDVGSVMTASIALGIAVDDTIHLLVCIRREMGSGRDVRSAVRSALLHSGPAVLRTSLLGAAGMLVLSVSTFMPTARFGLLIAFMLVAAVIGDLVMLPALINSKIGSRVFERSFGHQN